MCDPDYYYESCLPKARSMDDSVGRWRGIYDPTADGEVDWLLYVAVALPPDEGEE